MVRFVAVMATVLFLPSESKAESPPEGSKWIYITPEWVAQHPGRLKVFGGTAASGLNSYGFQFKTAGEFRWRVTTRLFPKKSGVTALYETSSTTGDVTNTVEVGYVENAPYAFDVAFHIERLLPANKELPELEYVIKLADWDRLNEATQRE
jgi:hypothetical protein